MLKHLIPRFHAKKDDGSVTRLPLFIHVQYSRNVLEANLLGQSRDFYYWISAICCLQASPLGISHKLPKIPPNELILISSIAYQPRFHVGSLTWSSLIVVTYRQAFKMSTWEFWWVCLRFLEIEKRYGDLKFFSLVSMLSPASHYSEAYNYHLNA